MFLTINPRFYLAICMLLLVTTGFGISLPAHAIVDIHDEYYAEPEESLFTVFGASVDGASGDKDELNFSFENHTVYRKDNRSVLFVGEYLREEASDLKVEEIAFVHLRYASQINGGTHGYEVFAQHSRDIFASLTKRNVVGGGYRFEWIKGTDSQRGLLGIGAIDEHEEYEGSTVEQDTLRANLYVTAATPIGGNENAVFAISAYAQPAFDDTSDLRAIAVAGVTFRITENFDVNFSIDYQYNSTPGLGLEDENVRFASGFTYTFK